MSNRASLPIPIVVQQHVEESAVLCNIRASLVNAGHVKLHHLRRLDERLAAHLDGLAVAGDFGWRQCEAALTAPGIGEVFAATVRAIEGRNADGLARLVALAQAVPESQAGVVAAIDWVSPDSLQDIVRAMMGSSIAFLRQVGLVGCALHRVDPGEALALALTDTDAQLRASGLRVAGECGRRDLLGACVKAAADADADCRFWAARSAVLLGDRNGAIQSLQRGALAPGLHCTHALALLLKLVMQAQATSILKALFDDPGSIRTLIPGVGIAGNPDFVPWLIAQMEDLPLARLAGESFSMITGLDLAWLDLERKPPDGAEPGPNDDPENDDVAMDEDEGLPWPDPVKVQAWWSANSHLFQPGVRYFMGAQPSWEHCLQVLRDGYQRQRIAAAEYLCLLRPGTMLFNCKAPAWRQQRWLAQMMTSTTMTRDLR